MPDAQNHITLTDAARLAQVQGHAVSADTLRRAAWRYARDEDGNTLQALKLGRDWVTTEDALLAYLEGYRPKSRRSGNH
jgi:hypothetical protein